MQENKIISIPSTSNSYRSATGEIGYTLLNDFMFKLIFQERKNIEAFLCSLLQLKQEEITSIIIKNPIHEGETVTEKTFILDLDIELNNNTNINIELQISNHGNWTDRSLAYLCRTYDELHSGENYKNVKNALHISILDFTLFPDYPEFYAKYRLMNIKTHQTYNSKFQLNVLELNQIEEATEEDKCWKLDKWARLFKAKTWEEVKKLTENNQTFESIAQSIFASNSSYEIRKKCYARMDALAHEKYIEAKLGKLADLEETLSEKENVISEKESLILEKDQELSEKEDLISKKNQELSEKNQELSEKNQELSEKEAEIASLKEKLAGLGYEVI